MNMQALMKQAQAMQKDIAKLKNEVEAMEFEGVSSFVTVRVNGKKEVLKVTISKEASELQDDFSMLEDMILLATNTALAKVDEAMESKMGKMTWFYIHNSNTDNNNFIHVRSKGKARHTYNTGVIVHCFNEDDFSKMRIRRGFGRDNAIIYISNKIVGHEMSVWHAEN